MTIHSDPPQASAAGLEDSSPLGAKPKPHLVFGALAASGHTLPMIEVAAAMVKRGYTASFLGGSHFAPQLERAGVQHVPVRDAAEELATPEFMQEREAVPVGLPRLRYDLTHIFIGGIAGRHEVLVRHLEELAELRPGRQMLLVLETWWLAADALFHGAPLPRGYARMPRSISVNVAPLLLHSIDTGPAGTGLPPDSTPSGRLRNALLNQMVEEFYEPAAAERRRVLRGLGATREPRGFFLNDWATAAEVTLQTCAPSLEFERSDLAPSIRFVGSLPPRPLPADLVYPPWWWGQRDEAELAGKKVVAVAQGTVATNPHDLIAPALRGLAGRDDVVVVAILGVRGGSLPAEVEVPANARVLDYFPYDAVLARADVWVHNAGYGGVQHSINHGVPLVVAGASEDKAEMAMRIQCAGIGVNLAASPPTPEQVRAGVDEVLANPAYRQRVLAMMKENQDLDALSKIEAQIVDFTE